MWRVVSSERFSSGLVEIETQWSLDDVYLANDVLDLHERLEQKAYSDAEAASKKKGGR